MEIIAPDGNYDFEHKYLSNDTVYECPAKLSDELSARIQNMVVNAYRVLGCAGWGRAEVLVRAGFSPREIRIITRAIREHREQREGMSLLGELLHRADNLSRACHECSAKEKCYKFATMETGNLVLIY